MENTLATDYFGVRFLPCYEDKYSTVGNAYAGKYATQSTTYTAKYSSQNTPYSSKYTRYTSKVSRC